MNNTNLMKHVIEKCDLLLEDSLISKEELLKVFSEFIANTYDEKKHNVGFILHTGSICFDIILITAIAISNLVLDETEVDDVINSFEIGVTVIYDKQRFIFGGFEEKDFGVGNKKYILLQKDETDKTWIDFQDRYKIEPYKGDAKRLDGRGIRKSNINRLDFISNVLEISINKIPSIINSSAIVVMSRERADKILNGLTIHYDDNKTIKLLEIVTASYFTDNDEYPYGGNRGKTEPVIKITGKVSVARDLLFENNGNKINGLMISGNDIIEKGKTELPELLNRRSLKYVYLSANIDCENCVTILDFCDDSNVFACTKDFLIKNTGPINVKNDFTKELNKQTENIINKIIRPIFIESQQTWVDYRDIKKALYFLRNYENGREDIKQFIIYAYALLNLFLTALFPIGFLERLITEGYIDVVSPYKRIENLWKEAVEFPNELQEKTTHILKQLEYLYFENYTASNKENALKKVLLNKYKQNIAIIVPKAYYIEVLNKRIVEDWGGSPANLTIVTCNRFDNSVLYDNIIVSGYLEGKRFNPFKCGASPVITILTYEFEAEIWRYKLNLAQNIEARLNALSTILLDENETYLDLFYDDINDDYTEVIEIEHITYDLTFFINQMVELEARGIINKTNSDNSTLTDIVKIGSFSDGEMILFTKLYKAHVFNAEKEAVFEVNVDELEPGNKLVFTKNDDLTKNIVDNILENLLNTGTLNKNVKIAYEKSGYWKSVLQQFMIEKNMTYNKLSKELAKHGCRKHQTTLRSWIDKNNHVVGPNDEEAFIAIAKMTKNPEMLEDAKSYCEACKLIRKIRTEILKMIGVSFINKLSGNIPDNNKLLKAVFDNVSDLGFILQLDTIVEVNELKAPANLLNRPINC